MIQKKTFIIVDIETDGTVPNFHNCIQIGAVAVDPIRLSIIEGTEFNANLKPLKPENTDYNALVVNNKTVEELESYPAANLGWADFVAYLSRFNPQRSKYTAPILCGYNVGFDISFLEVLAELFGPWNKEEKETKIWNFLSIDILPLCFLLFENVDIDSLKLDTILRYLGIDNKGSHDALQDVKNTALAWINMVKRIRQANLFQGELNDNGS